MYIYIYIEIYKTFAAQDPKVHKGKWQDYHTSIRDVLEVTRGWQPWTQSLNTPKKNMIGVPNCARQHDLIDIAWAIRLKQSAEFGALLDLAGPSLLKMLKHNWFVDISQSVFMRPWGPVPTLCTGAYPLTLT
jgi:hypothetical protein